MNHLDESLLNEYLDGELPEPAVRTVEAHLLTCNDCRARLDELNQLFTLLDTVPEVSLTADLSRPVLDSLRGERRYQIPRLPTWARVALTGQLALALLMLVMLIPLARPLWTTAGLDLGNSWPLWFSQLSLAPIQAKLATLLSDGATTAGQWLQSLRPELLIPAGQLLLLAVLALLVWLVGNGLLLKDRHPQNLR